MKICALAFSLLLLMPFTASAATEADNEDAMNIESLTVLSSSSLTVPLTEISKQYSRDSNTDINVVYNASADLIKAIEEGDPGDIIITSSRAYFDKLKNEGLIDNTTVTTIAGNSLSVIAAKEMKLEPGDYKSVLQQIYNKTLMIISNPETTALGTVTREALQKLGLWQGFEKRVVLAPTSLKTVDLIIKGQSAGIVYTTDALLYAEKIDKLSELPANSYEPITYYAAVVVSSNMDKARKFLKYLSSKPAKQILKQDGFLVK